MRDEPNLVKPAVRQLQKIADNVKHDDAYEEISMMITTGENLSGRRPRS